MRPVYQGHKPIERRQYRAFFPYIKNAIGLYCSYCERPLPDSELHVEHVRPKSTNKEYVTCWNNLLLACFTCNSHKDKCDKNIRNVNDINFDEYAFPHIYDTYHMIDYPKPTYMPTCNSGIDEEHKKKVKKILKLIQLENVNNLSEAELRAENELPFYRILAGEDASELRRELCQNPTPEKIAYTLKKIERAIRGCGFWSIWMKEFEDVREIREFLLDLIPGTEKRYYRTVNEHKQCEHEHKYNDIIGILRHRLAYKKLHGNIHNQNDWNYLIDAEIVNRLPNLTNDELSTLQTLLSEIKK